MANASLKACLWTGLAIVVLLGLALIPMAGFVPPPSPALPGTYYAAYYRDHLVGIRLASVLIGIGASLYAPFFGALAQLVRRMEGGTSGVWTFALLLSTAVASTTFFLSGMFFGLAAFRPEQSPALQQLLNDLAWIELVIPAVPATIQAFAIGFAILQDRSGGAIMPRWAGYANLWFGVLFLPGCLVAMWKVGPFAWDGFLSFWIPAGFFCLWLIVLMVTGLKAANRS